MCVVFVCVSSCVYICMIDLFCLVRIIVLCICADNVLMSFYVCVDLWLCVKKEGATTVGKSFLKLSDERHYYIQISHIIPESL